MMRRIITAAICIALLSGCSAAPHTVTDFSEMNVIETIDTPLFNKTIRIVDNEDYFSFGPSSATIYVDGKKFKTVSVKNDGVQLHEDNFNHEIIPDVGINIIVDGCEQEPETIFIPFDN